jgi:hypothetical protein
MSNYIKTNILCMGFLSAFALIACSHDAAMSQNFGTTEEKNAFWDESSNLKAWKVMKGSEIKLEANKNTLMGRVSLDKSGADNFARAGIVYDVSNTDGSPTNLSMDNDGLCIAYQSDFIVEVRLDTADYANSSVDKDLPFVSMSERDSVTGSQCVSWKDFKMKNSDDVDCSDFAKKVRSVQLVFVGESGSSGNFDIQRLTPYVRMDLWFGKLSAAQVETGFAKGDEGTSGKMIFIEDSSQAYIDWIYDIFDIDPDMPPYSEIDANIVFSDSNSNPDVGFEFLVAGKTTKNDQDFIYTADVSGLWMGMCLEYKSQMDIVMELVPGDSLTGTLENNVKTMTFAKNNSQENTCIEFAEVLSGSDSEILKHLAKIRVLFAKENRAGTSLYLRRISALVPENLSVRKYGEYREVIPTDSSEYKSGKSFLWNGAVDGAHVNLGIANAPSGGIWTNAPEQPDMFLYLFPDDVVADDEGNFIPSLVSKYHGITLTMKGGTTKRCPDIDCYGTIGFNTVSSNLEPADISAWDGFCIHYRTDNKIIIVIFTDVSEKKYWTADVEFSDDMVWGKVSWDAFKNNDKESNEKIEDALGKITKILLLPYKGKTFVDKFGSYDQCGE